MRICGFKTKCKVTLLRWCWIILHYIFFFIFSKFKNRVKIKPLLSIITIIHIKVFCHKNSMFLTFFQKNSNFFRTTYKCFKIVENDNSVKHNLCSNHFRKLVFGFIYFLKNFKIKYGENFL